MSSSRKIVIAVVGAAVAFPSAADGQPPARPDPNRQPVVVRVSDGFRWGDAAIGAAAATGAAAVIAGAGMYGHQRRKEHQ